MREVHAHHRQYDVLKCEWGLCVCVSNLVSDCRQSINQLLQPLMSLSHLQKD